MRVLVDVEDWQDGIAIDRLNGSPDEALDALSAYGFNNTIVGLVDDKITELWGCVPGAMNQIEYARYMFTIVKV